MDWLVRATLERGPVEERVVSYFYAQVVFVREIRSVTLRLNRGHLELILRRYILVAPPFLLEQCDIILDPTEVNGEHPFPVFFISAWSWYLLRCDQFLRRVCLLVYPLN